MRAIQSVHTVSKAHHIECKLGRQLDRALLVLSMVKVDGGPRGMPRSRLENQFGARRFDVFRFPIADHAQNPSLIPGFAFCVVVDVVQSNSNRGC